MKRQIHDDQLWLDKKEILNLANNKVKEAISNALNMLSSSIVTPNRSLRSNISLRYRSSSHNRSDRKVIFHNGTPRFSLPGTNNDPVHYRARLLSYQQTHCRTSQNLHSNESNRTFDVHYSFSLYKPWLDKERHDLINIQNFANELIDCSIRTALFQIDYENLITENETSCVPIEHFQAINSFVNTFIQSTIEQSIENIFSSKIECLSYYYTENIITDALSIIANNVKTKKRSIETIHNSSCISKSLTNDDYSNQSTVDTIVNHTAQQIYLATFDKLRQIFAKGDTCENFIY